MVAIIRNHNMATFYLSLKIETYNTNQTLLVNLQHCHVVSHVGWQLLPEIAKMDTISLLSKIETCNKNLTQLSIHMCQPTTLACCWLSQWQPLLEMTISLSRQKIEWFSLPQKGDQCVVLHFLICVR